MGRGAGLLLRLELSRIPGVPKQSRAEPKALWASPKGIQETLPGVSELSVRLSWGTQGTTN